MKSFLTKIHAMKWVLLGFVLFLFSLSSSANDFLEPGIDGYKEMVSILGHPVNAEKTPDGVNYLYRDMIVNISGGDTSTILTVTYLKPNIYRKYAGLDVGMTSRQIKSVLRDFSEHKEETYHFIADYERSVIFWFKDDRAIKYVQARRGSLRRINQ